MKGLVPWWLTFRISFWTYPGLYAWVYLFHTLGSSQSDDCIYRLHLNCDCLLSGIAEYIGASVCYSISLPPVGSEVTGTLLWVGMPRHRTMFCSNQQRTVVQLMHNRLNGALCYLFRFRTEDWRAETEDITVSNMAKTTAGALTPNLKVILLYLVCLLASIKQYHPALLASCALCVIMLLCFRTWPCLHLGPVSTIYM